MIEKCESVTEAQFYLSGIGWDSELKKLESNSTEKMKVTFRVG